ncbi:MAG: toprim domain-containing protein [Christensenellaceae bacterium]
MESSDPKYGFGYNGDGATTLYVFEAPIYLLSFISLYPNNWQNQSHVSLCGTAEHAMIHALEQNRNLRTVALCLDNDEAGAYATERLTSILREHGYADIRVLLPALKDWNDVLCAKAGMLDATGSPVQFSMTQFI